MTHSNRILSAALGVFIIAATTGMLHAQSRKQVTLSGPRTVGSGEVGRSQSYFRSYSTGVGNLAQSRPLDRGALYSPMTAGRGNTLYTSIQQQQYIPQAAPVRAIGETTRSIRRTSGPQPTGTGITEIPGPVIGPANTSRSTHTYNPTIAPPSYLEDKTGLPFPTAPENLIADYDVTDPRIAILRQLSATRSSMSHVTALAAIGSQRQSERPAKQGDSITTLALTQPGLMRKLMQTGEQLFREGKYREAESAFSSAVDISSRSTEALISLSRARLALGQFDLAGMNLAEALRALPELPLTDINPQRFYDKPEAYGEHVSALSESIDTDPWLPNHNLLLAYHLYRSDKADLVREPLERALAIAKVRKDEDLEDAILILWDALVAKGMASQELVPADHPAEDDTANETDSDSSDPQ